MKIPIDLFIKSYFMMDVLWVIFLVIMYGLILFILIKLEKERKELIQKYNKLVDEYNQLEEVNIQLRKEIKASLNRQLLDFFIGNCNWEV